MINIVITIHWQKKIKHQDIYIMLLGIQFFLYQDKKLNTIHFFM